MNKVKVFKEFLIAALSFGLSVFFIYTLAPLSASNFNVWFFLNISLYIPIRILIQAIVPIPNDQKVVMLINYICMISVFSTGSHELEDYLANNAVLLSVIFFSNNYAKQKSVISRVALTCGLTVFTLSARAISFFLKLNLLQCSTLSFATMAVFGLIFVLIKERSDCKK